MVGPVNINLTSRYTSLFELAVITHSLIPSLLYMAFKRKLMIVSACQLYSHKRISFPSEYMVWVIEMLMKKGGRRE